MLIISLEYTPESHEITLWIIFLMYVAIIQSLNYRGKESKTCSLQFIFLKHLRPWNRANVIKPTMTMWIPSKVIITQSLKDLILMMSQKMPTLENISVFSLAHVRARTHTLTQVVSLWYTWRNQQLYKFQLNRIKTYHFQSKLSDTAVTLKYNQGHWK